MASVEQVKIFLGFILFVISVGSGYIPYYRTKQTNIREEGNARFLSMGNMFSSGIFLGGGLLHLLAEAALDLQDWPQKGGDLPIAYVLCALGFFSIFFVEEAALAYQSKLSETEEEEPTAIGLDMMLIHSSRSKCECVRTVLSHLSPRISLLAEGSLYGSHAPPSHLSSSASLPDLPKAHLAARLSRESDHQNSLRMMDMARMASGEADDPSEETERLLSCSHDGVGHTLKSTHNMKPGTDGDHDHLHISPDSGIFAYVLILALSFHSFFEGIALGTQDNYNSAATLFIAIAAHTPLASFCLGVGLLKADMSVREMTRLLVLYASFTPMGVAAGVLLTACLTSARSITTVSAFFNALASGTFLFVALAEILPKEMSQPGNRLAKVGLCVAGFALMAVLKVCLE
eukprot:Rmarinus@m.21653